MSEEKMQGSGLPIPFGWYALAYSEDLNAGEVQTFRYFDQELVLYRSESGKAIALDAYCPHLGAHLGHGGKVVGEHIACPFHAWEMDATGSVANIPYAKNIPKRAQQGPCLHSFPTQERNQLIWVWYHPDKIAPTYDIEDIPAINDPDWSELQKHEWEINVALQEAGENAVDIAHFVYVHGTADMPKATIAMDGALRTTDMVSRVPKIDEEGNMDLETTEDMHLVTKNFGPGLAVQEFARAFKTVMMASMVPITADRIKLRFAFTKPKDITEQFNMYTDVLIDEIVRQVHHDMPIWEHKTYHEQPILCDGDGPINKYRKWFEQFYASDSDDSESRPLRAVQN